VPTEVGVKVAELALEVSPVTGIRGTGLGTPDEVGHNAGPGSGPHTVKTTVPVGAPPVALPMTVTESLAVPVGPMTTELGEAVVMLDEGAGSTLKHSAPLCWATSE
jgi:hypothetical protein